VFEKIIDVVDVDVLSEDPDAVCTTRRTPSSGGFYGTSPKNVSLLSL